MKDDVFGELNYHNGWEKELVCEFWNAGSVMIKISAYENEMPNQNQKDAYRWFLNDLNLISRMSRRKMEEYLSAIAEDILPYCKIHSMPDDICSLVTVNHILFMESGNFAVMCDAEWDDHGAAVLCMETKMTAGPQDIVWMYE